MKSSLFKELHRIRNSIYLYEILNKYNYFIPDFRLQNNHCELELVFKISCVQIRIIIKLGTSKSID